MVQTSKQLGGPRCRETIGRCLAASPLTVAILVGTSVEAARRLVERNPA